MFENKYPAKGLYRISISVCFFLHRAENEKKRQNRIVQRDEKKRARKAFMHVHLITVYEMHGSLIHVNKRYLEKTK